MLQLWKVQFGVFVYGSVEFLYALNLATLQTKPHPSLPPLFTQGGPVMLICPFKRSRVQSSADFFSFSLGHAARWGAAPRWSHARRDRLPAATHRALHHPALPRSSSLLRVRRLFFTFRLFSAEWPSEFLFIYVQYICVCVYILPFGKFGKFFQSRTLGYLCLICFCFF